MTNRWMFRADLRLHLFLVLGLFAAGILVGYVLGHDAHVAEMNAIATMEDEEQGERNEGA